MAKKQTVQQQVTLPEVIATLYRKLIDGKATLDADWHEAGREVVLPAFRKKAKLHTAETPTIDTSLKSTRAAQYATLRCSEKFPTLAAGSDSYKLEYKRGQQDFGTAILRALVSMGYWKRKARGESNSAAAKAKAKAKAKAAAAAAAAAPGSIPVIGIAAKLREIAERVAGAQKAVAAFQTIPKVPKAGVEAIGALGLDLGALATVVEEVTSMLESGKVPDKPDGAIQEALNKMLAVQNGTTTAPASTTPQ